MQIQSNLLNGIQIYADTYPLCWMVVLSIVLQDGTPEFVLLLLFLRWFFNWYLFLIKVSEELFSIICKHLVLTESFTSFYISPYSLGFCLNFQASFTLLGLLLFCTSFSFFVFFLQIFWVSPFCVMSVRIDNSALMLLIWSSILVFHIRCCHLLPFVLGIFGILPIFLDITYAFTYFSRLMFLRLGTSSAITSWIAWFACSINSSTFLFTYIMGRRGLTVIMMFSHSALPS